MKNFIKNIFSTIIAFFIAGFLLVLLFIGTIVFFASQSSSKDTKIRENSILALDFKNNIVDYDTESASSVLDYKTSEDLRYYDIITAIENAKNDEKIKGISIELSDINAGHSNIEDIRNSLEDFKKSGKFIYAYGGSSVSQSTYYLGSVADKYFLHPMGMIELKGLSKEVHFMKDFAEKLGININIIRHGKFKAAVEPFILNEMSAENREQNQTLLNDIWENISAKIIKSRKLNIQDFQTIVDNLYGIIPELSIQHKLADKLVQKSEYDNILKQKLGLNKNDKLNKISLANYINNQDNFKFSSNKIAVLYASGTIYNGNSFTDIHSEKYINYIKDLANDDQIKAVVLRVNSPGGSATASDEILFELNELKQKKPLIVSFGDYAASGGYYISMASDRIFAQNTTITGSIGVFGIIPNAKKLAERNGIYTDVVNTNANSNMISPTLGLSTGTEQMMKQSVVQTYNRFINFVAKNRKMTPEQVNELGEGRVWSGKRAKELGLVDEIGNLNDAIKYAVKKANLDDYEIESYPAKMDKFQKIFSSFDQESIMAKYIENKVGKEHYQFLQTLSQPQENSKIQMAMPYIIKIK